MTCGILKFYMHTLLVYLVGLSKIKGFVIQNDQLATVENKALDNKIDITKVILPVRGWIAFNRIN